MILIKDTVIDIEYSKWDKYPIDQFLHHDL